MERLPKSLAYNSWEPNSTFQQNAPETLSNYWDEVEAVQVQAAESGTDSDSKLAPGDETNPAPLG